MQYLYLQYSYIFLLFNNVLSLKIYNAVEAAKNICCVKGEGAVDDSTVTRWFKTFCSSCKALTDYARSSRPKMIDSKVMLKAIETNSESIRQTWHLTVQCVS